MKSIKTFKDKKSGSSQKYERQKRDCSKEPKTCCD